MMEKGIKLADKDLKYKIRISRLSKRIRLTVYSDGSVVATIPPRYSLNALENFMLKKSDWILKKLEFFGCHQSRENSIFVKFRKKDYRENKDKTLQFVRERLQVYAPIYGVNYKKVAIRNQKARWGSCSRKGNLSFNFRLIYLPEKLADYIIVHELCHLLQFNHSKEFWNLVAKTFPDYREARNKIRTI